MSIINDLYSIRSTVRKIYNNCNVNDTLNNISNYLNNTYKDSIKNIDINIDAFSITIEFSHYANCNTKSDIIDYVKSSLKDFILNNINYLNSDDLDNKKSNSDNQKDQIDRKTIIDFINQNQTLLCDTYSIGNSLNFIL